MYRAAHNLLLGHANAYKIYRKEFKLRQKGQVGIVLSSAWFEPATNSTEDLLATNRSRDFELGWFAEPIFKEDYPEIMRTRIAKQSDKDGYIISRLPEFSDHEKAAIKGSADFLGLNYYSSLTVKNRVDFHYGVKQTEYDGGFDTTGLYNYPQGLKKLLAYASKEYKIPILVTENGFGDSTGALNDTDRINYIKSHLTGVLQAIEDGANVIGYTAWSLMDNFEWGAGFTIKYGIHHVDFTDPDRKRTPKESAKWYKQIIANGYIDDC